MKLICSFVLLRHLFWFMRQLIRISWTCGTRNELCKFRQKIKWIGLENCRINNMTLKRRLRSTYSWSNPWFQIQKVDKTYPVKAQLKLKLPSLITNIIGLPLIGLEIKNDLKICSNLNWNRSLSLFVIISRTYYFCR